MGVNNEALSHDTDLLCKRLTAPGACLHHAQRLFVDARSGEFERLWRTLDIGVDQFERTSSASHKASVQAFWQTLAAHGDIYRGQYTGLYCIDCEQYFTGGETCPVPGDDGHVMYAWIDALVSYLSALSPGRVADFDDVEWHIRWAYATHFIGKDILTFHAIYWPALLFPRVSVDL